MFEGVTLEAELAMTLEVTLGLAMLEAPLGAEPALELAF